MYPILWVEDMTMRPEMTMTYSPVNNKPRFDLSGTVGTLIRFLIVAAIVVGVGYFLGDSVGLWDLTQGSTIDTIQQHNKDIETVQSMLRGG